MYMYANIRVMSVLNVKPLLTMTQKVTCINSGPNNPVQYCIVKLSKSKTNLRRVNI